MQNNCSYWKKNLARLHVTKNLWSSQFIISLWKLFSINCWCTVINCNNKTQNSWEVSYFWLSKGASAHKDWIHDTGCQVNNLPTKVFISSDHFEENCFDHSWKLYYKDHQKSRRLLPGSIPTLLLHKRDKDNCYLERELFWKFWDFIEIIPLNLK